jgi:hypothetical protein
MIGIVDTTSDANPDDTICSAHVKPMLLPDMNSSPISASFHISPLATHRLLPAASAKPAISTAEMMQRAADTTGADRCSPAIRIPA